MKLLRISVFASIAPLLLQTACSTVMVRPSLEKREIVYVTVTEVRYVPMAMPSQAPAPAPAPARPAPQAPPPA
ncbi:hypothetical protein BGZ52_007292, partial [Haplosporangium bisporale]